MLLEFRKYNYTVNKTSVYESDLYRIFQITNLMHNSFILQQYVCYITILNTFRAAPAHPQKDKLYYYSLWYRHPL